MKYNMNFKAACYLEFVYNILTITRGDTHVFTKKINSTHALYSAQVLNNYISSLCELYPTRFVGLGTLPMQSTELAIKELERIMLDLNLKGIEIGTNIDTQEGRINLSDEKLFPIFSAAESLGAAIFIHPWNMMEQHSMQKYWLPLLVGMPAETSLAICSTIFSGVYDKFPKLKIAFAHGGGAFPATAARVEHAFHVRPDLCAIAIKEPPLNYCGRFWVDSLVHDLSTLRRILDLFGQDKVALGSDYPFPLGEFEAIPGGGKYQAGELIQHATNLSQKEKQNCLHQAAIDWLKLDIS